MRMKRLGCFVAAVLGTLSTPLAAPVWGFEGRLLLSTGAPAAGYEVTVVGRSLSSRTDGDGRFSLLPSPPVPFVLIATSPNDALSAPLEVNALPASGAAELTLPESFRDSITVVSGVAPSLETPPAAATTLIGREDLEQRRPQRLSDTLEGVAGASRSEEGPVGVPAIRGLARGRTLVLLDGARVSTERRAGAAATFLDPFTLGSVEVARGPGSVAYGSDAFGGVIAARSRYAERGPLGGRLELSQGLGASDESAAGLEISGNLLGGALLGVVHAREAGEAEIGGGDTLYNSSYRDRGGALRWSRDSSLGRLRVGVAADGAYDTERPAVDSRAIRTVYPVETSSRFDLGLDTGPRAGWDNLELALHLGRYRQQLDRDRQATATSNRRIDRSDSDGKDGSFRAVGERSAAGGRLQLGAELVTRFDLEAIAETDRFNAAGQYTQTDSAPSIDDARRSDLGVFALYQRPTSARTLVSMGLRGDRVDSRNRGGFYGDRSASNSALSGQLGIVAGPFSHVTASLQVARGFRDPTLSDRYFRGPSGRGFVTGNPDLDPEVSLQWDGSLRWERDGRSVVLYGYNYEIQDLVERFQQGADFFFRNRGEATIRGLELEAQTPLAAGLSLQVALAVARGEAEDGSALDDIAAPGGWVTLRWSGASGFAYLRPAVFLKDDRPGPTELARPGVTTLEAGGGWRFCRAAELRLTGRNLTDRRYVAAADETSDFARGRSFSLGLVGRL